MVAIQPANETSGKSGETTSAFTRTREPTANLLKEELFMVPRVLQPRKPAMRRLARAEKRRSEKPAKYSDVGCASPSLCARAAACGCDNDSWQRSRLAPRGGAKGKRCDDLESVSVLLPRRSEAATFARSTPEFRSHEKSQAS